jgi:hypothetical protein
MPLEIEDPAARRFDEVDVSPLSPAFRGSARDAIHLAKLFVCVSLFKLFTHTAHHF